MTLLTKSPSSPETIAALKKEGQIVVEVTVKRYYILHNEAGLAHLMKEWFIKFRGRSHAYRDGSHVGGADEVQQVRILTTNETIDLQDHEKQEDKTQSTAPGHNPYLHPPRR